MGDFWSSPDLEPKRQFRFMVSMEIDGEELNYAVRSADRPSYTIGETEHRFFNHTFYYPGRMTWNTITLTFVDSVDPGAGEKLYNYLAAVGINNPSTPAAAINTTITKKSAVTSLGDVRIRELGSGIAGNAARTAVLGEWSLLNPFITEVNFGSHSYDSDDMVEISVTLRYDWANYTVPRDGDTRFTAPGNGAQLAQI